MDLISKCRRIYSKVKFSGRADYFYQSCRLSSPTIPAPTSAWKPNVNFPFPTSVLVQARTPADDLLVLLSVTTPCEFLSSLRAKPDVRMFLFHQYMPVTREGNRSYLSLTFLCEFRVYLSMEICTKKLQMEYLPTFLIHDRHLAKWEDDVNNKTIFKWTHGPCRW